MTDTRPTVRRIQGVVVEAPSEDLIFFVINEKDSIQRFHYAGAFYESEDLTLISKYTKPGMVYLDVGSNVGNHAIYFAKRLNAAKVVVFEPNAAAYNILRINLLLNKLDMIDTSYLGKALGDRAAVGRIETRFENNLGLGVLREDETGDVEVVVGDDVVGELKVDFLKIDVEGGEMAVLAGLRKTIAKDQPTIYIEVDNVNTIVFFAWCKTHGYVIVERIKRYEVNENFLIVPLSVAAAK